MCETLGLGELVDAFIRIRQTGEFPDLQLRATGGLTKDDHRFLQGLEGKLEQSGLAADVRFEPDMSREQRVELLSSLSILSVPNRSGEAFGLFVLEALAAGVPVVQPHAGAFPEIVNATGGGILYRPENADALTDALLSLLRNPDRARELGRHGRQAVLERYGAAAMAARMAKLYEDCQGSAT
jgi:glycosyltransferase involved in cell wall biosynthesis